MKIFVSAAEISSDIHAEKILLSIQRALATQNISVEWMGIGGPRVSALAGFKSIESADNLRTMGFVEVLKKYSFFKALIDRTASEVQKFNPDLILTFDYPEFHLRLMQKVVDGNLAPNALRICGIPPKIWVWRSKRVEKIRALYHGVWVIFPFEKKFYESRGVPVIYEGNPLLENLFMSVPALKKPLETITVMPGSRDAELKYHLPVIPETLELFAKKTGKKITAQVPIPSGVPIAAVREKLQSTARVEYVFLENASTQSLKETQIGLIKSGTSTLEAVVLNCVPVIFYKMNWWSEQIFRYFIKGWGGYLGPVGLPNILLGVKKMENSLFPEILGPYAKPSALAEQLYSLYVNTAKRNALLEKCAELRTMFFLPDSEHSPSLHLSHSSDRSAQKILEWKSSPPVHYSGVFAAKKSKIWIAAVSFVWSLVNRLRRRLALIGVLPVYRVKTPSILVGNLQAGGSGKTPLVIALAQEAVLRGMKVVVVSRGYGSTPENPLGDEPQEILKAVPQVVVSVNANRLKAIDEAEKQNPDLLIFDDGFQNLKFKAHVNVIAVTDRARSEVVYRDFDSEIRFADVVIGTKGDAFRKKLNPFFHLEWQWMNPISKPVWILCGIADPHELIRFYSARGLIIKKVIAKPDHANFDLEEVKKLISEAKEDGCLLAMTEKDRVKIPSLSDDIYVFTRTIRNRDWIDAVFAATLERDESS